MIKACQIVLKVFHYEQRILKVKLYINYILYKLEHDHLSLLTPIFVRYNDKSLQTIPAVIFTAKKVNPFR